MGRRGPAPMPTALKLLTGNRGKRPINRREPKIAPAAAGEIRPLSKLSKAERVVWDEIVAHLAPARVLTKADALAVELAVRAVVEWRTWLAMLAADGRIITKRNDKGIVEWVGTHPAVRQALAWQTQARHQLAELGMSPASRSRVKAGEPEKPAGGSAGSWRDALLRG